MIDLGGVTVAIVAMMLVGITAKDEMIEYGFGESAADRVGEHIHAPFDDFVIVAEETLGKGGALTRSQVVYLESLYRSYNIGREREIWEGLKRAPERERFTKKRPTVRREVVRIFGKKVVVHRNLRNGQFCSARTRRR